MKRIKHIFQPSTERSIGRQDSETHNSSNTHAHGSQTVSFMFNSNSITCISNASSIEINYERNIVLKYFFFSKH